MIKYIGFDPVEVNPIYADGIKPDRLTVCEEIPNEKLFVYAKGNEIKVPKLNIEKKEPLEIESDPLLEALIKYAPYLNEPPRELISKDFLEKEILPKLNKKENENMSKFDATKTIIEGLNENMLTAAKEMSAEELKAMFECEAAKRAEEQKERLARENEQRHLDNPFYQRAKEYREEERYRQILKGAEKYPKPFEPMDWTPKQLLQHAMQENIDQAHYIYGLYEHLEQMELALQEMQNEITTLTEQRNWEKGKADKLERQVEDLQTRKDVYGKMLKDVGRLTKFLVTQFPEAGNAGDLSVDVAIELLKNYRKYEQLNEQAKESSNRMLTEMNSLGKYLIVHYPQMVVEGEWATEAAKRVMDAYRNGGGINAKG